MAGTFSRSASASFTAAVAAVGVVMMAVASEEARHRKKARAGRLRGEGA